MPDTPSITIVKRFTYRGQPEDWSNKYHFSGDTPATPEAWDALRQGIWDAEKAFLPATVRLKGFLGHEAGNEFAVYQRDYIEEGLAAIVGTAADDSDALPGDAAVWVRWRTPERNSRGKWIYCRKFFHGVPANGDVVAAAARTAMVAYGAKMINGTLPGGAKICGPQGAVASSPQVAPYVSFRQLKRTGKRPSR